MESKYEFRRRLEEVHKKNRRDPNVRASDDELEISDDWSIVVSETAGALLLNTAKDLQDYLFTSMHVSVRLSRVKDVQEQSSSGERVIVLATKEELQLFGDKLVKSRSYRIAAEVNRIVICGYDDRGAAQGSYYLEDQMNLREAPVFEYRDTVREPLFSPRMAHSGWGLDRYPDAHLNAMAHAGIDAVMVFVKDVDHTPEGYQDFNYLIDRAALYGLDVYVYSYLSSRLHPDDPDAPAYYESTYGKVFQACPRFKGVILVGESCEFPSKDPNTTGKLRLDWPADQPQTKPSPGWWPCTDFPQWLNLLSKTIRAHNSEADIVFWTYNWGWAPKEDRLKLIHALPDNITLLVTFEMFEQIRNEDVTHVCVDYTLSNVGPGEYFSSEAEVARERGIKLYAMSNTGGLTWDIGVIPYEPFPDQWNRRHSALLKAQEDWGLCGLMESHHYGWWPSFISDITKQRYWSPSPSYEEVLAMLAKRDFSERAAPIVVEAWKHWSEAIRSYISTNEDQYGPFRVGPSYPLVFRKGVRMPAAKHAMFGNEIVETDYSPMDDPRQSLGISRIDVELRSLERMLKLLDTGNGLLEQALALTPGRKMEDALRMLGLGRFIARSVQTTIHVKQWWKLKQRLFTVGDASQASQLLEQMEQLAEREIANAEATIPIVEADSRLGWEPSMEYMTDADHLRWKINQVRSVLQSEFGQYRSSLALTDPTYDRKR
ncbi:hypothetical protein Back11_48890 [Paenibacillus baekrokdamisoli]|uniref:Uncharacterized protein n=1 Tax=Paenibacillus baekrokdamisoli TaxID=1712516 RepID=A0A3G9JKU7_9BACL|nr:hypothetical protein [Paenibacillus baekrokdamisoli]MBB3068714.1 hypothetical protein [Paenibacillus baekrokdamisoli]BBH23544.1 hypothetical protein Back11_48890 [Paenibacillus baekrokdamisoli]